MAFVVKVLFLSAIVYSANAGLSGHSHDTYVSSALSSPSASFGPPSKTYGPPSPVGPVHVEESVVDDHGPVTSGAALPGAGSLLLNGDLGGGLGSIDQGLIGGGLGNGAGLAGADGGFGGSGLGIGSGSGSIFSDPGIGFGPGSIATDPGLAGVLSDPSSSGNGFGSGLLPGSNLPVSGIGSATIGAPRVIGTSVTVGRPDVTQTQYQLQSVVQNVVRRIPVEVTRHIQVAVPQPVPVPVRQEVKVPVPQPYPVPVDVVKHVPYPVYKTEHVEVERPVPVEVLKEVPVEVIKEISIPIEKPYEVIKKVHVPVVKHVEVPVPVWKPYPLHIIKHVKHYKKKSCCW